MRAAQTEVDERPAGGRLDAARRLRADERREVQAVQHRGLDQLRLEDGSADLEQRLVGEEDGAFGEAADVPTETKGRERLEEFGSEASRRGEEGECRSVESEVLERLEEPCDPGSEQVAPAGRERPAGDLEGRRFACESLGEVALRHRQLVEVDDERRFGLCARRLRHRASVGVALAGVRGEPAGARRP